MSDFFHEDVPLDYNLEVIEIINKSAHHTFQILTKRSDRIIKISQKIIRWPNNAWLGVTVEAKNYKKRIAHLKQVDCGIRFLSCEPLLEDLGELDLNGIDWVIVEGESGPGARPMDLKWATNLRDQCVSMGVPFFLNNGVGKIRKLAGESLREKNGVKSQIQFPM